MLIQYRTNRNPGPGAAPAKLVRVNGVDLHYVETGKGVPVVFVHGAWMTTGCGTADGAFRQYRVIAYSRRYNYPNENHYLQPDRSAVIEAEDLAALIRNLTRTSAPGRPFLGALTVLFLALKHPELVRTIVLAEPPVLRWTGEP